MYYPTKDILSTYGNHSVAFEVGKDTKDSYSIITFYRHDIETDTIKYTAEVIKNSSYDLVPKSGRIDGKKYKETVSSGTLKQCFDFIDNIVKAQGHYIQDPSKPFNKVFVEPS